MTTNTHKIDEIYTALRTQAGALELEKQEARLFLQVLRELARGAPIPIERVDEIAGELNLPVEKARETLNWIAEKNENGEIAGLAGLSTNEWNHGFAVNGTRLATWCALDTLYLPPLLRQTVKVDSRDPATQEMIRVTVGTEGVEAATPPGALISIVIPQVEEKGLQSAEQIWNAFCSYSHYFASEENARAWFAGKEIEPLFLTIEEGFELGRKWFESVGKFA